jgi:hypothetical protein
MAGLMEIVGSFVVDPKMESPQLAFGFIPTITAFDLAGQAAIQSLQSLQSIRQGFLVIKLLAVGQNR